MRNIQMILLITLALSSCGFGGKHPQKGWAILFANDDTGATILGNKERLRQAVHQGCPIRVGWVRTLGNGETLEHVADSAFLSVYKGEVFAQIEPIMRQSPDRNLPEIRLDSKNNQLWYAIIGTNGILHSTLTGSANDGHRKIASNWYINAKQCRLEL